MCSFGAEISMPDREGELGDRPKGHPQGIVCPPKDAPHLDAGRIERVQAPLEADDELDKAELVSALDLLHVLRGIVGVTGSGSVRLVQRGTHDCHERNKGLLSGPAHRQSQHTPCTGYSLGQRTRAPRSRCTRRPAKVGERNGGSFLSTTWHTTF